jgi:hypothetical protein
LTVVFMVHVHTYKLVNMSGAEESVSPNVEGDGAEPLVNDGDDAAGEGEGEDEEFLECEEHGEQDAPAQTSPSGAGMKQ